MALGAYEQSLRGKLQLGVRPAPAAYKWVQT